eukprot:TRINITY_DN16708_c0_g1_i1.p1 TRINITY_DN16708_c0_g1~~TRINITY_DN16708_c0_g1_i1.p1  ORF type:complete len:120 (+),score=15.32 TRINITY_DN16708_c0_g1_i1:34-393(+)
MSSDEIYTHIIDRLIEEKFVEFLDAWCRKNCRSFHEASPSEHTHDQYESHQAYCRFYESKCEAVLKEKDVTSQTFYKMCEADAPHREEIQCIVDVITAVGEYKEFHRMMHEKYLEEEME